MKIYVVSGSTGEYSDRTDWMVRAYADEATAKAVVVAYDAKAKEVEARTKLPADHPQRIKRTYSADFKWPHPDPDFLMGYTGTSYGYGEIEFVPSASTNQKE